ncbi:tRNA adenosine(34) deaminase TadA [Rothia sp. ZJ932]|uniref:tRNA adenosine(34) deaminase TadA n=1 Tax=Rothia sp. ZJ932 TaxID=2810516 RepID=UPI0021061F0D|nr:tRNA adenosine(34) deaminase TadA [Rothia sp. ZJ932]
MTEPTTSQPVAPGSYLAARRARQPHHEQWMRQALMQARQALEHADVPIGAIVVDAHGEVISRGYNQREAHQDPTAHAEVIALREAARVTGSWRLDGCTLVVTLEPCLMCAGAILLARVPTVVFGAWEEKMGAAGSVYDTLRDAKLPVRAEVYSGVLEEECADLLTDFFMGRREPRP